jgi:hypothetical protein
MIAVRMLSRAEFQELLRPYGCTFICESEILGDGIYGWSYWRASWGFFFSIPEIGSEQACPEDRFHEILMNLAQRAPR